MTKTVLILGASGKIGIHSARAFEAAGWEVRRFNRATGDMAQAAMGCDVILNGMNPPNYHNWAEIIPQITADVIKAARASGATVILPGNVYVYGNTPGTWDETTPHRPCSRKGAIRAEMERTYRDSGVQVINLRAGNFIDPDRNGDVMSVMILNAVAKGKFTYGGPGTVVTTWAYLPDWARAAVMLAERRADLATYEDIPFAGNALTLNEIKARVERLLGYDLRSGRFPWWLITLSAPVWELARELREMRYLWQVDHRLSGAKLARLLPEYHDTDLDDILLAALPKDLQGKSTSTQTKRWREASATT